MEREYSVAEAEFYRRGNGARTLSGLSQAWILPAPNGALFMLVPGGLQPEAREAAFEEALCCFFLLHYGEAETREQLRAWLRGDPAA